MPTERRASIAFGAATPGPLVLPLTVEVRIDHEYDISFLEDRIRAELFIGDRPTGVYAVSVPEQDRMLDEGSRQMMMRQYAPELTRLVIQEFSNRPGRQERAINSLGIEVASLREKVDRPRWWHRLRPNWSL